MDSKVKGSGLIVEILVFFVEAHVSTIQPRAWLRSEAFKLSRKAFSKFTFDFSVESQRNRRFQK